MKARLIVFAAVAMALMGAAGFQYFRAERQRRSDAEVRELERRMLAIQERSFEGERPPPEPPPLALGPPQGASQTETDRAILELLSGRVRAGSLPLVATPNGVSFDGSLHDRLSPRRWRTSSVRDCNCPPGNPLCSCL